MLVIRKLLISALALILISEVGAATEPSVCFGTTSNGRLENGWKLPARGPNFRSYSTLGRTLGRTYVHSWVHHVVVSAYAELEETSPETVFVYGETGKKEGGAFAPHKTHRNGLSVDFMVPVRNEEGQSVPLPTGIVNKWGYDLEFDSEGRLADLTIDFHAIADHIYHLHRVAKENRGEIWRVILAPDLQPHLRSSPRWAYLEANVKFSERRSWVRHDDHYHIDFIVRCEDGT